MDRVSVEWAGPGGAPEPGTRTRSHPDGTPRGTLTGVSTGCVFCGIAGGHIPARIVDADDDVVAFLDTSPLLPGHVLVMPRAHHETLDELPTALLAPLFSAVKRVSIAVQAAMPADGSFVAVNTRVSQSVAHLHVHVVPRRHKDGLFSPKLVWHRRPYPSESEADAVAERIKRALKPV